MHLSSPYKKPQQSHLFRQLQHHHRRSRLPSRKPEGGGHFPHPLGHTTGTARSIITYSNVFQQQFGHSESDRPNRSPRAANATVDSTWSEERPVTYVTDTANAPLPATLGTRKRPCERALHESTRTVCDFVLRHLSLRSPIAYLDNVRQLDRCLRSSGRRLIF